MAQTVPARQTVQNMTEGSPVSLILRFALPIFISQVFQQLYSTADAFIVGKYLGTNALMLGAFAAIYQQQGIGLGVYVLGVLPHGIFELSALILSCALGLLICRTGTEWILKKSDTPFFRRVLDCIRVFLTFSVPLLLVAALIETYVTPALLNLVL